MVGIVSVQQAPYNAVGNGTTDDTAAFTAALTSGAAVVEVPYTSTGYRLASGITVPAGVVLTGAGFTAGNGGNMSISGAWTSSAASSEDWALYIHNTGGVYSIRLDYLMAGPTWATIIGSNISTGTWYKVDVKIDKTNGVAGLYLNGAAQGTTPVTGVSFYARSQRYISYNVGDSNTGGVANSSVEFDGFTIDDGTNGLIGVCK